MTFVCVISFFFLSNIFLCNCLSNIFVVCKNLDMDVRGCTYGVVRERKAFLASSRTQPSCPHYQGNLIKKVIVFF